jgi:hypothetical protein
MDFTAYFILISVFLISIYDFYNLNKIKVITSKCFKSSSITLVISFFIIGPLSVVLSMIYINNNLKHEVFLIIAATLVAIFNFIRINGRKVINGKIVRDEKSVFTKINNKIIYAIIILFFIYLFLLLIFVCFKYSFIIWDYTPSVMESEGMLSRRNIIVFINNFLHSVFGSLSNKVASVLLFFLGTGIILFICTTGYAFLNYLKKMKR